jgi:hypothetical protein
VYYREFWSRFAGQPISIGQTFNRLFFYRLYKKYGIGQKYSENVNTSVTHELRHNRIKSTFIETEDIALTAETIGHKSVNSTLLYITEPKKKKPTKIQILKPSVVDDSPVTITKTGVLRIKSNKN